MHRHPRRIAFQRARAAAGGRAGRPRARGAFTLVELLVVIAIIALLVTMISPGLARIRELARRSVCATNLQALGGGWAAYFGINNQRPAIMHNPSSGDNMSQLNFRIYTITGNTWCNAGVLYHYRFVSSERVYVCPTIDHTSEGMNPAGEWFHPTDGSYGHQYENLWPPQAGHSTHMTYSTRRFRSYNDPALSNLPHKPNDPADDHLCLLECGVQRVRDPTNFAYMSDTTHSQEAAAYSHVPGINVLCLGGNVKFFEDTTEGGTILYDNGTSGWGGTAYNWLLDDIWMIIDGFHQPPVGQGLGP